MRPVVSIFILLALLACARAQEQESGMMSRLESSRAGALDAMNNPKKKHPELSSSLMNKSFAANNKSLANRTAGTGTFTLDKKMAASGSYTTRSFLGIKNPWFGQKVVVPQKADLWTKNAIPNSDTKFATKTAGVKNFADVDKKLMNRDAVTETRPYLGKGTAQGAIDLETAKGKDMTIDQVRDLLNKSKPRAQAQAQVQSAE